MKYLLSLSNYYFQEGKSDLFIDYGLNKFIVRVDEHIYTHDISYTYLIQTCGCRYERTQIKLQHINKPKIIKRFIKDNIASQSGTCVLAFYEHITKSLLSEL